MKRVTFKKDPFLKKGSGPGIDVMHSRGVSVKFLSELLERIINNKEAPGVTLNVVTQEFDYEGHRFQVGDTIRLKNAYSWEGEVPYFGQVKFKASNVRLKERTEWTMEDVYEYVVKPAVEVKKCSYVEIIQNGNRVGRPYEGAFISQARKTKFASLIDSLLEYYSQKEPRNCFVWLDVFSVRHPLSPQERQLLIDSGMRNLIERFEERLVCFQSWINPLPINDAWCVWELYCITQTRNTMFEIILPSEEQPKFVETLIYEYKTIMSNIRSIDSKKAISQDPGEQKQIHRAIRQVVNGHRRIDERVKEKIWMWLAETAEAACEKLKRDPKAEKFQIIELTGYTGKLLKELGRYNRAKIYMKLSMKLAADHFGKQSDEYATRLNNLGSVYSLLGDFEQAMDAFVESLNIRKKIHGRKHPSVAVCLNNLALLLQEKGRYKDAIACQKKALDIDRKVYGDAHPEVATDMLNLAEFYSEVGRYNRALDYLRECLAIRKEVSGEEHPSVATVLNNIAGVYCDLNRPDKSVKYQEEALAIDRKNYGSDHGEVATDLSNLATYLSMVNESSGGDRTKEALKCFHEALAIKRKVFGRDHSSVATILNNMATLYRDTGKEEEAMAYGREAVEILEKSYGKEHRYSKYARLSWSGPLPIETAGLKTLEEQIENEETSNSEHGDNHSIVSHDYTIENLGSQIRSSVNYRRSITDSSSFSELETPKVSRLEGPGLVERPQKRTSILDNDFTSPKPAEDKESEDDSSIAKVDESAPEGTAETVAEQMENAEAELEKPVKTETDQDENVESTMENEGNHQTENNQNHNAEMRTEQIDSDESETVQLESNETVTERVETNQVETEQVSNNVTNNIRQESVQTDDHPIEPQAEEIILDNLPPPARKGLVEISITGDELEPKYDLDV